MKNIETIREDLNKIRYYNSKKEWFDKMEKLTGRSEASMLADQYNKVICMAPPRLYEYFVYMYVLNNTQEALADDLNYSRTYVYKISQSLLEYLQAHID